MDLINFIKTSPHVRIRESVRYPGLFVVKYAKSVFYKNLWNKELEQCRGLVLDSDYNIVSYPFTKIYNYGIENRAPKFGENEVLEVYRKVNGFMAAITWHNDALLVSTTGSLDSPFVDFVYNCFDWNVEQYLKIAALCKDMPEYTFMYECVHPDDPHIVPEETGLYLLGYREKEINSPILTDLCNIEFMGTISQVQEAARTCKHEGFVFYAQDGRAAKIKSPYYLVQKFVARNPRTDKLMRPDIKQSLDEEYYPLIDAIQADIEAFTSLTEQERLEWVRNFFENGA